MRLARVLPVFALALLLVAPGCKSNKPGGQSHAALEVPGHSLEAIQAAAVVVMAEQGYQLRTSQSAQLVFDRAATSGEKFKYGDWMNEGMLMQFKLRVQERPSGAYLLRLDQYAVHDPTDVHFRTERRIMALSSSSYKKLLEEIRTRLDSAPASVP